MIRARVVAPLALAAAGFLAVPARPEVRSETFRSAGLGRDVRFTVDLPASYGSGERRYPVIYALHGLFEGPGFWERRGLAAELARLREEQAVREFLVVCVDGGNSFFVNGPPGAFQDLVTRDIVAHVEATYRVLPGRAHRALLGISMGGYGALRIAFTEPHVFSAVATHSAMLLDGAPDASDGAGRGHLAAFRAVFGDPIDKVLWDAANPLLLATRADPKAVPALYFDCGAEDRYGLAAGQRKLQAALTERQVPFTAELPPGDHGYEFVRSRLGASLRFLDRALGDGRGRGGDR